MKKILLLSIICSIGYAQLTGYYSNYNDGTTLMEKANAQYAFRDNIDEYSINGAFHKSPGKTKYNMSLNADWDYQKEVSYFLFTSYNNDSTLGDYTRLGYGLALLPDDINNMNVYPYYLKVSAAIIHDSKRSYPTISTRIKFKANVNKITTKTTIFLLGYSETFDLSIGYKLNKNLTLKYIYDYERIGSLKSYSSSAGVEIKL